MDWEWYIDLVKYNDTTWTVYDIPNPYGIFGLGIFDKITIDNAGSKWIAALVPCP